MSQDDAVIDRIKEIANDKGLLEIGRAAVEKVLIEWRDSRLSEPFLGSGLVIREKDGAESATIRLGPDDCLRIGLRAIAVHLMEGKYEPRQT